MDQGSEKKGVFAVPSLSDIKETSKIKADSNKPSIFQAKASSGSEPVADKQTTCARDPPSTSDVCGSVSSAGEASSSTHQDATARPAASHPHAIVVNPLQVGPIDTVNYQC